jgi:hypothetical protein
MDAERSLHDTRTGDILMARTARTARPGSRAPEWTKIGVVVHPADIGVQSVAGPVFYTVHGTLGELLPTMNRIGHEDLRIAVGETGDNPHLGPEVHAAVRAALITAQVEPVDQAGEIVLSTVKRHAHTGGEHDSEQARDPGSALRHILDVGGRSVQPLMFRHCRHGKIEPCDEVCPPGST